MKVLVKMDKEPSKENYVDILRSGNELLRSKESHARKEGGQVTIKQNPISKRLLGFGPKK